MILSTRKLRSGFVASHCLLSSRWLASPGRKFGQRGNRYHSKWRTFCTIPASPSQSGHGGIGKPRIFEQNDRARWTVISYSADETPPPRDGPRYRNGVTCPTVKRSCRSYQATTEYEGSIVAPFLSLISLGVQDEDEDWSRWRDVVFRAKGALNPHGLEVRPPPPPNRKKRGGHAKFVDETLNQQFTNTMKGNESGPQPKLSHVSSTLTPWETPTPARTSPPPQPSQLSDNEVLEKISTMEPIVDSKAVVQEENLYCPECYLPLHPDPKPERLHIFLHALRYTTSLGSFETKMPEWAAKGWTWDQSWD